MIEGLKPVCTDPVPCKICGGASPLYGVVDFQKNCEEAHGLRLPLCGVPIYYRRCADCDFLFTDAFDDWSDEQFKTHIYNDDYCTIDPDYQGARPRAHAAAIAQLWGTQKAGTSVLDYGGGNGVFCASLLAEGFPVAVAYDPMIPEYAHPPDRKFDLVTCLETIEHLPDPLAAIGSILSHLAEGGLVLLSTWTQPADFNAFGLCWWYVGPRNGHISIFSKAALARAFGRYGYKFVSLSDNVHLAFDTLPQFMADLDATFVKPAQ